jgi:predicted metal-dependent HD superfamily phosphohydrolase
MPPNPFQPAWEKLLTGLGASPAAAREGFHDLAAHYAAGLRHYHTLDHVAEVAATARSLADLAADPAAVELAAWFHDAVYDPRAADNEEQSARYAGEALTALGLGGPTLAAVGRLILATKHHQVAPGDVDGQILLDADLAVLGAPAARYAVYAAAIRQEYAWVPDADYRVGRAKVLAGFIERGRIYHTGRMFEELEETARRNLVEEIRTLNTPS